MLIRRESRGPTLLRAARRTAARVAVTALLVTFPLATTLLAVRYAPPAHVEIAGQSVSVKPVLGRDTSQLLRGALVRPEHARLPILGKSIGVDVDADWNRLIPSDQRTRAYLTALWDDPTPQIGRIQDAARHYVVLWSAVGFGAGALVSLGSWLGLVFRRRRLGSYAPDLARAVRRHNRRLRWAVAAVATAGAVAADSVAVGIYAHDDHHVVASSPVFAGTNLEGTEVNGLAAEVLPFLSILRPRSNFYDKVSQNLTQAIADQPGLVRTHDETEFVLAEDFEDVDGMARQVGLAADLVDASFLAITGDLTFAGLSVETYLIDTVDYYSGNRTVYFTPGLHDTPVVIDAAKARGWHVADGRTVEADGVKLLTAPDPRLSTVGQFGAGNVLRDPDVDPDRFVVDTVDQACQDEPDFVVLHDHLLGRRIAEAGCQRVAVLDGRSYLFVGPQTVPTTTGPRAFEFTGGSTGGHVDTRPDPGVITHAARFAILTVDRATRATSYAVVTVQPDASVTVTPEISLGIAYQHYLSTGETGLEPALAQARPGRP